MISGEQKFVVADTVDATELEGSVIVVRSAVRATGADDCVCVSFGSASFTTISHCLVVSQASLQDTGSEDSMTIGGSLVR
ncbi:MAG: hypothetical protein ACYCW6_12620 [Candidatus Xenobia bacterium]